MSYLKYEGNSILPGVPARDLTAEEVEQYGGEKFLIGTGLYKATTPEKSDKKKEGK
jgi:hypothetical protein